MTSWQLLAPLWFDTVRVLGHKCHTSSCFAVATSLVWWPGDPNRFCQRCTASWVEIARTGFAMDLAVQPLPVIEHDDASAAAIRFSLLELDR